MWTISTASQSLPVAAVMSARSGQIAVVRETWIFVRGASSCVLPRFATLAAIARVQAFANHFVPRARRGTRQRRAFQDFLIRLAHAISKAAISRGRQATFFV